MGHGWVNPHESGAVARCGGPSLCRDCATEVCRDCGRSGGACHRFMVVPVIPPAVVSAIDAEWQRQDAKWGTDRHLDPLLWLAILAEEFGEVAEAVLERDAAGIEKELTQVAAVCAQWLAARDFERRD